jgi:hypothetical protein
MNERIKALAAEAGLLSGFQVGEVEYQKFAELIIEEINKINYEVEFLHTAEKVSLENKYRVRFGVET